ncbi:MAG: HDOD domain-containing protein [Rhodopirellula sp.]|nr:HDOD domain-containing protein [Rhodopirellula sp.]
MTNWTEKRETLLGGISQPHLLPDIKLPVLPQALVEFSQQADNPDCEIRNLATIVESDTGLTCQLLKTVNASHNGLRHRISSAHHAIATLGIRRTKLQLITVVLQESLSARQLKLINLATFWNANLERAIFARQIAKLLKADEYLAFSAALLVDFLLPVLTNDRDDRYIEFLNQSGTESSDLCQFEQQHFGCDHAEDAARVMFEWGFPDDLICCVMLHHHGLAILADPDLHQSAAAAVAVASLIPDPLRQSVAGLEQLQNLSEVWNAFDLQEVAEDVYQEYQAQSLDSANYIPVRDHVCKRRPAAID